jgi:hypothetical protein
MTTVRSFMAWVFFTPRQLGTRVPVHGSLTFHLDPYTQPKDCVVQIGIVESNWLTEDPAQGLAFPYVTMPLGSMLGGSPSPPNMKLEPHAHMVGVDVTQAAQYWVVKQPSPMGFVFKAPHGCALTHLTQITLFLDHAGQSA